MTDETPARPLAGRPSAIAGARNAAADAVRFFTRLPVPAGWTNFGASCASRPESAMAIASPLAGALVGVCASAALILSLAAGLPPLATAVVAAIVATIVSGALHLDGLADVADGLGGATREKRLEIMRDSRLGTFGGAALTLALMLRIALVTALVGRLGAGGAALAIIAAAELSRPLAFLPSMALEPAREDGLGRLVRPAPKIVVLGVASGAVFALACMGLAMGIAAIAMAIAASLMVIAVARRKLGGFTGDVCGATSEVAELAALIGLLAAAV